MPGFDVEGRLGHDRAHGIERGLRVARVMSNEDPRRDQRRGDRRNLSRRLAQTEDDFRKPLPNRPLVVDAREAEVFVVRRAERLEQLAFRVAGIDRPAS